MYLARIYSDTLSVSPVSLPAPHLRQCHSPTTSSYWEQLPRTQIIADSAKVAERIKAEARWTHDKEFPTAVLFLSDSKYTPRFDEMIKTWSKFAGGKSGLVMAALDEATEAYFQERGVKTVRILPELLDAEKSVREAVLRAKVEVPYVFLLKGLRVVMVEMDIYCRSSPLHLDKGTADVLSRNTTIARKSMSAFGSRTPRVPLLTHSGGCMRGPLARIGRTPTATAPLIRNLCILHGWGTARCLPAPILLAASFLRGIKSLIFV